MSGTAEQSNVSIKASKREAFIAPPGRRIAVAAATHRTLSAAGVGEGVNELCIFMLVVIVMRRAA
jgi:hypothetical protein